MSSEKTSMLRSRKRQLCLEAESTIDSSSSLTLKRRKLENQRWHWTLSFFWVNLSRVWLTLRALREFDRRTEWPAVSVSPERTGKKDIDLAQLKRFARHDESSLNHLRAVSLIQPSQTASWLYDSIQNSKPSFLSIEWCLQINRAFENESRLKEN